MAKVHIENPPAIMEFLKSDLILEDLSSWSWPKQNDSTNGVTNLSYREFMQFLRNLEKEKLKKNPPKSKDEKKFEGIGGLFRIRWNLNKPYNFSLRTAIVTVAYGLKGNIADKMKIESYPNDILYIGKSRDVRKRVDRMFSSQKGANLVTRKLTALLSRKQPGEQPDNVRFDKLKEVMPEIIFDFVLEEHPVKRDFMKAYAVSNEKPCLNIGLEH